MKKWKANSWRNYPVKHIPEYRDEDELNLVLNKLKNLEIKNFYSLEKMWIKKQEEVSPDALEK